MFRDLPRIAPPRASWHAGFRAIAALALLLGTARPAVAHAFGSRYDLPLPLGLYLLGAGAAVGLSFAVMALFLGGRRTLDTVPRLRLLRLRPATGSPWALAETALEALAVGLFALVIAAGLFGSEDPTGNLAPVLVWVVWWVGLAFVSALLGDLWRLINPWAIAFRWFEALLGRLARGRPLAGRVAYPEGLGAWPAVLLFLVFAWLELLWGGRSDPAALARVILIYSFLTWAGMFAFGRRVWLERGEVFTLVFSLFARFAPLEARGESTEKGLYLRPYALGLLAREAVPASLAALVLALLATVTFDGFAETPAWLAITDWAMLNDTTRKLLSSLALPPPQLIVAIKSVALFAFPVLFAAVFLAFAALIGLAGRLGGGPRRPLGTVAGAFVLTLVPIAIAYHLAHYLLFLLQTGQFIVPLISDPFGYGWDLFGTAAYEPSLGIVNAKTAWYLALGAIVTGHVFAVYLAHVSALRLYGDAKAALASQLPMIVLMIGYTVTSLWILSQPIVA